MPQQIKVLRYSFSISTPYAEGHRLTAQEAQALNGLRLARIRTILSKRLAKQEGIAVVEAEAMASALDSSFSFEPRGSAEPTGTIQEEIEATALEAASDAMRRMGMEPSGHPDTLASWLASLRDDPKIVTEAERRFAAKQEVAKAALEDLLA